jgi:leucyl-tRNA synthetase
LKSGLYDFTSARDAYREMASAAGVGMHKDVVLRYIELQALMLAPIAPHWAEYIWLEVLKKVNVALSTPRDSSNINQSSSIHHALFPTVPEPSPELTAAQQYVRGTSSSILSSEAMFVKRLSKGKTVNFNPRDPKKLTIYAAKKFPAWQEKYIDLVRDAFDTLSLSINDKELNAKVGKLGEMKKAMPFVQTLKKRLVQSREDPKTVFERKLPFDEFAVLAEMVGGLKRTAGYKEIEVIALEEGGKSGEVVGTGEKREGLTAENAVPGNPTFQFSNVAA